MRLYWAIWHPHTYGTLVAIWYNGTILLIRNSYLRYYSLPGGYIQRNETAQQAAIRELAEEIGLSVTDEMLTQVLDINHNWQGRSDHVKLFVIKLTEPQKIKIDNREVIAMEFFTPENALKLDLYPPIRQYINDYKAKFPKN